MKKRVVLCALLTCASTSAHCPCSGKPCGSSNPCGPCAQEQAQSRAHAHTQSVAPGQSKPRILSPAEQKNLARIQAKQAIVQKLAAQQRERIIQKKAWAEQVRARELARIIQKIYGVPLEQQPSVASVIALAQTASTDAVEADPVINTATPLAVLIQASPDIVLATAPSSHDEKTELEWTLIKSITTALTPLITAYPTERLIPADPAKVSFDEHLEQMHTIATFVTKLKTKLEVLTPEAREFIKTASFAGNPIARMLARNLLSLQSFFESQLASYKQVKPQSTLVKELKKLTTSCAKEVDALCKELLNA